VEQGEQNAIHKNDHLTQHKELNAKLFKKQQQLVLQLQQQHQRQLQQQQSHQQLVLEQQQRQKLV
jgi:hypothetical protein